MSSYNLDQLYPLLQEIQKPGRYTGGEFGIIEPKKDFSLRIALCFPDLYEIGMSNQAIKILYNLLNSLEGVQCERVFAPHPDFEKLLSEKGYHLYSLETFTPLKEFDVIAFSVGYELSFTNILAVLNSAGIALENDKRKEDDPLVIAGGPALTNPLPFGNFIDFIFFGEAESTISSWVNELIEVKEADGSRDDKKRIFQKNDHFWYQGISRKISSTRWSDFGQVQSFSSGTPVPSIEVVQDHGVVEIMRGCPNKCRFCHAGVFYRPKREKKWSLIVKEIDYLVHYCGYRTVTLSSLSTGDYSGIDELVTFLNERYRNLGVSFNLPSLRVNSISLKLLNLVSVVRKSGLTFAVEAPTEEAQKGLNKDVSTDRIIQILNEARAQGWKQAKFYFMLGLPVSPADEEVKIIEYLNNIQHQTRMQLNVNIGTFIPKSFTPFAKADQLPEQISFDKIMFIKRNINNKKIRISFHSPFASFLEGIFARGDERAGELALRAFKQGARLDAWEEHLHRDEWKKWIAEDGFWEDFICRNNSIQDTLNQTISLGITQKNRDMENTRAIESTLSPVCEEECNDLCGVCNSKLKIVNSLKDIENIAPPEVIPENVVYENLLISYGKNGRSIFMGHLDVMHAFEKAFIRSGLNVVMSQGFNPKPKIEFANPLSLGLESEADVFSARIYGSKDFIKQKLDGLKDYLPQGILVQQIKFLADRGKLKLMQQYTEADWELSNLSSQAKNELADFINTDEMKPFYLYEEKQDTVFLNIKMEKCPYNNPLKLLRAALEIENPLALGIHVKRTKMYGKDKEGNRDLIFNLNK